MGKIGKRFPLILILLVLFALGFTNSPLLVKCQATGYHVGVHITSPIQNETYQTNNVPLNFTLDTNITESNTYGVAFVYNLDGQLGYHDGHATRIGWFNAPLSSSYSTTMNVPDGNHLLWVQVGFYVNDPLTYIPLTSLSQIVNFTVSTATPSSSTSPSPNLSSSPAPTETPTPAMTASLSESASALNYGNTVNFTVSTEGGTPPYIYAWYVDGGVSENSSSPYFSTNSQAVGSHHVYVRVSDADNNSATTLTVEFNVLPTSSTSPSLSPTTSNSPKQQPTQSPDIVSVWGNNIVLSLIAVAVIVIIVLLVLFLLKRK